MVEEKFIKQPVKKLFFTLAVPNVLSMVFSSIYMISDGIFVGRFIGDHALAAVNLVMPIMMIVFALSNMVAIGAAVKVSTMMGAGKTEDAKHLFTSSVLIIIGTGVFFLVLGLIFAKTLIFYFIKDVELAALAHKYVMIFVYGLPFIMPLFAMDNFLRSCGKAKYSMVVNIIVSLLNIALDWFFIAFMKWGIEFSALASVISMFLGAIFSFAPFFTKKIALHFAKPKMSKSELGDIIYNGGSEFFGSVAGSIIATVINGFLLALGGAIAVASYGVVMYIDTLLVCVLYGVLDSVVPVVSYNLGAGETKRAFAFFKISCVTTAILSAVCLAVIMIFPNFLASIFSKDNNPEVIQMTTAALKLFAPSYLFGWFTMVASSFLTAMDKPKESLIIMAFRAIIFPLACLFALTSFMGVYGVFFTSTVSGALTFVIALIMWVRCVKRFKAQAKINAEKLIIE